MEDPNSDDENQENQWNPRLVSKKFKIDPTHDDGSSSTQEATEQPENPLMPSPAEPERRVSENSNSDGSSTPHNYVTSVRLSDRDISFLRNFVRYGRNYRRRILESSDDSDDSTSDNENNTTNEEDGDQRDSHSSEPSDSEPNDFNESASVSDESVWIRDSNSESDMDRSNEQRVNESMESENELPSVLMKSRPPHNWFVVKELMSREMNTSMRGGRFGKTDILFQNRYYSSLHAIYRLELMYKLNKHKGCVNAIHFHPEGHLLASGSDDLNVVVWDWALGKPLQLIKTGHKSNVFQSKFLHLNAKSQLNIVTCARDGQVRLLQTPASCGLNTGNSIVRRKLHSHTRAVHKLHTSVLAPHEVYSAGEDGEVKMSDVRSKKTNNLFRVEEKTMIIPLYSIHGNPMNYNEICVAGRDTYVRVYDLRRTGKEPKYYYCPSFVNSLSGSSQSRPGVRSLRRSDRTTAFHVTCAVYNYDGTEILASYNDDDCYLFNTKNDVCHKGVEANSKYGFTYRYAGHRNSDTIKGVNFFGPKSEYVVSGSDCAHIYVWDKKTESIVQWMIGDEKGSVNCLEGHPTVPILATSGLDSDVKIWIPSKNDDSRWGEKDTKELKEVVMKNERDKLHGSLFESIFPSIYTLSPAVRQFTDSELDTNACVIA